MAAVGLNGMRSSDARASCSISNVVLVCIYGIFTFFYIYKKQDLRMVEKKKRRRTVGC